MEDPRIQQAAELIQGAREQDRTPDWDAKKKAFIEEASNRNASTINRWLPIWFENLRKNCAVVQEDYEARGPRIDAMKAIPRWFYTEGNGCALCVASGPSASDLLQYQDLLHSWKGLIICGPTNAALLSALGRPPDIVLAVDSSNFVPFQLRRAQVVQAETHLVTNPYIHPEVISMFPRERRFYYKSFLPYQKHPLNWYLTVLFNNVIQSFMLQAGSCANAQYAFCSLIPALSSPEGKKELLIKKIFLIGYDMCYPPHPSIPDRFVGRCPQPKYVEGYGWTGMDHTPSPITRSKWMSTPSGLLTDQAMTGYKRSLLTLIRVLNIQTYQCSRPSSITELPFFPLPEVLSSQGQCATGWDPIAFKSIYRTYVDSEVENQKNVPNAKPAGSLVHQLEPSGGQGHSDSPDPPSPKAGPGVLPDAPDQDGVIPGAILDGAIHVVGTQSPRDIEESGRAGATETRR